MPGLVLSNSAKLNLRELYIDTTSSLKLGGTINFKELDALSATIIQNSDVTAFVGGSALASVDLDNNKIASFPQMSDMPDIRVMKISNDTTSGTVPTLSANTKLESFNVKKLSLNGAIPNLENCTLLKEFNVSENNFSGNFPILSANLDLEIFDITKNSIAGPMASVSANNNLKTFNVGDNNITGTIPNLGPLTALIDANFYMNSLTGRLPDLSANTNLKSFRSYGNNNIAGPFPALPESSSLIVFDANNNDLSGSLPMLSSTPNLEIFIGRKFPNGQLTGPLPAFSAAPNLTIYTITGHQAQGIVPSLSSNTALKVLNINYNALSGDFPHVKNCTNLVQLRFNTNKGKNGSPGITGDIPTLSACTSIQACDVATNALTGFAGGPIPATLQNIQAQNNNLGAAVINAILAALVAAGSTNKICNLGGIGNAAPTGQGLTDKATLISRGWNVTTN